MSVSSSRDGQIRSGKLLCYLQKTLNRAQNMLKEVRGDRLLHDMFVYDFFCLRIFYICHTIYFCHRIGDQFLFCFENNHTPLFLKLNGLSPNEDRLDKNRLRKRILSLYMTML